MSNPAPTIRLMTSLTLVDFTWRVGSEEEFTGNQCIEDIRGESRIDRKRDIRWKFRLQPEARTVRGLERRTYLTEGVSRFINGNRNALTNAV